jgi:hypothetical protein
MDAEIPKSLAIVDPSVPKTSEERAKAADKIIANSIMRKSNLDNTPFSYSAIW